MKSLVLAGGRGRRLVTLGAKHRIILGHQSLLQWSINGISHQADTVLFNIDKRCFNDIHPPNTITVVDQLGGYRGPLAGIHSAMQWVISNAPEEQAIVSVPCDSPLFPNDLVARLIAVSAVHPHKIVLAADAEQVHPVFGLWPVSIYPELDMALREHQDGLSLTRFSTSVGYEICRWEKTRPLDFFNINTPEDLARAEQLLADQQNIAADV